MIYTYHSKLLNFKRGIKSLVLNSYSTESGKSSLVHVIVPEKWWATSHTISIEIYVETIVAIERLYDQTTILSFGVPYSDDFMSVLKHLDEQREEIWKKTGLKVTIMPGKQFFFSSDTFPPPSDIYLAGDIRAATWFIEFSGPLELYYRSIHCVVVDSTMLVLRDLLIFASGNLVSLDVALVIDFYRDRNRL